MVARITVLTFVFITLSVALEAPQDKDDNTKTVLDKFFKKIPDKDSKYIINEGLSKLVSNYFDGKVNAFPLFKVNVKIDRTPVKIPWTLDQAEPPNEKPLKKRYKYLKHKPRKTEKRNK